MNGTRQNMQVLSAVERCRHNIFKGGRSRDRPAPTSRPVQPPLMQQNHKTSIRHGLEPTVRSALAEPSLGAISIVHRRSCLFRRRRAAPLLPRSPQSFSSTPSAATFVSALNDSLVGTHRRICVAWRPYDTCFPGEIVSVSEQIRKLQLLI